MGEVITISNMKGGAGKTVTSAALVGGLHQRGFTVLGVDMDAQQNFSFLFQQEGGGGDVLDVLAGRITTEEAIQHTDGGDVLRGNFGVSALDYTLTRKGKEYTLRDALEPVRARYDYIIIDTPPSLGTATINALCASTAVIIAAQADVFSIQGICYLMGVVEELRAGPAPKLKPLGVALTRYSPRAVINRNMQETVRDISEARRLDLFNTTIRETVTIREATASAKDIFRYAPKSKAAEDYDMLIDEILERIGGSK